MSRYTLRVKRGDEILSRVTFESQFKSTGYYSGSTSPDDINRLLNVDVLDEARGLLEKSVEKISFPTQ